MVVVRSLTAEAILGLDFLQTNQAVIDLEQQRLSFRGCRETISLGAKSPVTTAMVCAVETISIPPHSELEVMGQVRDMPSGEVWLLEEIPDNQQTTHVARALVSRSELVPVRLLNHRPETLTIYHSQRLAVVGTVEAPTETPVASVSMENSTTSEQKQQTLWSLAEASCHSLTEMQTEQLYELLLSYADVFACSDSEVGRTNKIQHAIHTDAPPICQAFRRIPPACKKARSTEVTCGDATEGCD